MPKHSLLLNQIAEAALQLTDVRDADRRGDFLAMMMPQLANRIWIDALSELARDVWEDWHRKRSREDLRAELEKLATVGTPSHADLQTVRSWAQSLAGRPEGMPEEIQALLDKADQSAQEFAHEVETLVEKIGAGRPFTLTAALKLYLADIPAT